MNTYRIIVTALINQDQLDEDDRKVEGEYFADGHNEKDALDYFHNHVAIAVLDDFDISIQKMPRK